MARSDRPATPSELVTWPSNVAGADGISVWTGDAWTTTSYTSISARVADFALQLAALAPGAVLVSCTDPVEVVVAIFAAWSQDVAVAPVAPHPTAERLASLAAVSGARVLIEPGLVLRQLAASGRVRTQPDLDAALLQLTSGSTGTPQAVSVSAENILKHRQLLSRWVGPFAGAKFASWLPLHHDMGLVGMLLTAVLEQRPLRYLTPQQFITQPHLWILALDRGATVTAAPPFAYGYAARRVKDRDVLGIDLSELGVAIVGSEPLNLAPLAAFASRFRSLGFRPDALRPAYGLAEATLAVTGHSGSEPPRVLGASAASLKWGARYPSLRSLPWSLDHETPALVSSGRALNEVAIDIVDDAARPVSEKTVGEIVLKAPTVAAGYQGRDGGDSGSSTAFIGEALHTGDMGILVDDELFVLGRIADSIKVRGVRIAAEAVESGVAERLALPLHRVAVVPDPFRADGLVLVLEDDACPQAATEAVRSVTGPTVTIRISRMASGSIPRTTSGKPQRRAIWQRLASEDGLDS